MESVILKYPCHLTKSSLRVPLGSQPLHVGPDPEGDICVWFLCPLEAVREEVNKIPVVVHQVWTGQHVKHELRHLGSLVSGNLMVHYFLEWGQ